MFPRWNSDHFNLRSVCYHRDPRYRVLFYGSTPQFDFDKLAGVETSYPPYLLKRGAPCHSTPSAAWSSARLLWSWKPRWPPPWWFPAVRGRASPADRASLCGSLWVRV